MLLKSCILLISSTSLGREIKKKIGLRLDLDRVSNIQDCVWIAKHDSPLISASPVTFRCENFNLFSQKVKRYSRQRCTHAPLLTIIQGNDFQKTLGPQRANYCEHTSPQQTRTSSPNPPNRPPSPERFFFAAAISRSFSSSSNFSSVSRVYSNFLASKTSIVPATATEGEEHCLPHSQMRPGN